jgi:hypothetical protein
MSTHLGTCTDTQTATGGKACAHDLGCTSYEDPLPAEAKDNPNFYHRNKDGTANMDSPFNLGEFCMGGYYDGSSNIFPRPSTACGGGVSNQCKFHQCPYQCANNLGDNITAGTAPLLNPYDTAGGARCLHYAERDPDHCTWQCNQTKSTDLQTVDCSACVGSAEGTCSAPGLGTCDFSHPPKSTDIKYSCFKSQSGEQFTCGMDQENGKSFATCNEFCGTSFIKWTPCTLSTFFTNACW